MLGFGYRVALSRMVGAEVMGLYQLLMPVYSVLLSLTAIGLTAAVSNLTAQYLAVENTRAAGQVLRRAVVGFLICLLPVWGVVAVYSDPISVYFLGDARTQLGLLLLLPCVALTGLENLHKHFFYGAGLVRPPAVVELLEQAIRAAAVLGLLALLLPQYPEREVGIVVAGMVVCEVFSAVTLMVLWRRWRGRTGVHGKREGRGLYRRMAGIALPVGATALLGNLMGAANATLIPRELVRGGMGRGEAMAQFGVVCGMALPMLALPTVFLGAVNLVLMPRLARSAALNRWEAVRSQLSRALFAVSMVLLPALSLMVVLGEGLGGLRFGQAGVGTYLLPLAAAMVFGGYHGVCSAALNGVGRQGSVAAVALACDLVQLAFTWLTVRQWGMDGFVAGTLVSALLGLVAACGLVRRHIGLRWEVFRWLTAPGLSALLAALTARLLLAYLGNAGVALIPRMLGTTCFFAGVYLSALNAQGVSGRELLPRSGK